ncbi:MAG: DnaJ domain-containing protein [Phycisphaerales bacterium]|nr:DnaJ domain-containing protein [Phycisphaerales bacterium]
MARRFNPRSEPRNGDDRIGSRRRADRYPMCAAMCSLGQVVDLSASGMRVRCPGQSPVYIGQPFWFGISAGDKYLRVQGEPIWIRRTGLFGNACEIGVRFVGVDSKTRAMIADLARYGFVPDRSEPAPATAHTEAFEPDAIPEGAERVGSDNAANNAAQVEVEVPDLYEMFELPRSATGDDIRAAYRRLARDLHPDSNPSADAAEQFAELTKAYQLLKDPGLRRRYDELLLASRHAA